MTDRPDDVPLIDAMLLWDDVYPMMFDGTSEEPVVPQKPVVADHRVQNVNPDPFDNATGACFGDWRGLTDVERLTDLLRDAWMAVVRDKVDPTAMHEALLVVPEFRAIIHPGDLPQAYQEIDPRVGTIWHAPDPADAEDLSF